MTAPVAVKVDHAPVDSRLICAALGKARPAVLVLGSSVSVRDGSEQIGDHLHRRTTDWRAAR